MTALLPCRVQEISSDWEPVGESGLVDLELLDSGDFTASGTRYRQADEILIHCGPTLAVSKSAGDGQPLQTVDLTTGSRRHYQFGAAGWQSQYFLLPLTEPVLDGLLLFLPGRLHILPTLHHFVTGEPIELEVDVQQGQYRLRRDPGETALLEIHLPQGTTRRFQACGDTWFEAHRAWSELQRPAGPFILPNRAQTSFEHLRCQKMGKCWVHLGGLGSPAEMFAPGVISHLEFPSVFFHENGAIQVQNHLYSVGQFVSLYFLTLLIWGDNEELLFERWNAADDLSGGAASEVMFFRYKAGVWEQLIDEVAMSWWERHGGHVLIGGVGLICLTVAMLLFELLFMVFPIVPWLLDFLLP